jgi:hypothetical protein
LRKVTPRWWEGRKPLDQLDAPPSMPLPELEVRTM